MSDTNHSGSEIALLRCARFFSNGGLCHKYELDKDHLIEFADIQAFLVNTVSGLTPKAAKDRFIFSVKHGGFGRHGARQTIKDLIDLASFDFVGPGKYSLRPSFIMVEMRPLHMRARRSVWARWLRDQGWPVPPEFKVSVPTENDLAPVASVVPARQTDTVAALPTAANDGMDGARSYDTGAPGRPTSKSLVEAAMRRRGASGEMQPRLAGEAACLERWLKDAHPDAPAMKKKTIENTIRTEYKVLREKAPK